MSAEMGEYLVGAYLQLEEQCDVVSFNVRPPGGGLKGLEELDVIGLNFKTSTAYLCEVANPNPQWTTKTTAPAIAAQPKSFPSLSLSLGAPDVSPSA